MAKTRKATRYRNLASIVFTVLSVIVIGYYIDPAMIVTPMLNLDGLWIAGALAVFLLNYALRTLRFSIMLDIPRSLMPSLYGVTATYGMLNYLLPAKSGELTYPLLTRRYLGLKLSSGSASLVVARLMDFMSLSLYLPLVLISFWEVFTPTIRHSLLIFCATFYCIAGVWYMVMNPASQDRLPSGLKARLNTLLYSRILKGFSETLVAIHKRSIYRRLLILTLFIWLCVYLNFYMIVRGLGYEATLLQMITVSAVLLPLTLIPLQGVANIGSHEIAWVTAMSLYGYSGEDALAISVGTHAVLLLFVLILGIIGLILIRYGARTNS